MDENKDKILGFYVACEHDYRETDEEAAYRDSQCKKLSNFLWGEEGLDSRLSSLKYQDYGNDVKLFLLEFQAFPSKEAAQHYKDIQSYRAKEKSIGSSIIVNEDNFFNRSEQEQREFLHDTIMDRLGLLAEVVRQKNLDTDVDRLLTDVKKLLSRTLQSAAEPRKGTGKLLGLFKNRPSGRSQLIEEPDESSLVVTVPFKSGEALGTKQEREQMRQLEEKLEDVTEKAGGELDGHDVGEGEYNIYMYDKNVDKLLEAVRPVLTSSNLHKVKITKRYLTSSDDEMKEEVVLL